MSDLQRFIDAQAPLFDRVLAELQAGRKQPDGLTLAVLASQ